MSCAAFRDTSSIAGQPYTGFRNFSFRQEPGFLSLTFFANPGSGTCDPSDGIGVCATGASFRAGEIDAYFVGDTDYKITLASSVPAPATWAMMIVGFGLVGGAIRRRKTAVA
jgi:hypothetical protein